MVGGILKSCTMEHYDKEEYQERCSSNNNSSSNHSDCASGGESNDGSVTL
jgi:hypothetical protein